MKIICHQWLLEFWKSWISNQRFFFVCVCWWLCFLLLFSKLWSSPGISTGTTSAFFIYAPTWSHHTETHFISFHCYSCILHKVRRNLKPHSPHKLLTDIKKLIAQMWFLRMNSDKTEILIIGPDHLHPSVQCFLGSPSFGKRMNKVFPVLLLSFEEYCQDIARKIYIVAGLLLWITGMNQKSISRLQMVQNAAARLLMGSKKREHITPVFTILHCPPICFELILRFWSGWCSGKD